ncbi:MAG TPA: VOC family protein [Chloroflexota bacterium]|nr:VOC family protein [Chloroflexota bacterium]
MSIKVLKLHHANMRLQTPDQARDFYGRVLGLAPDPTFAFDPTRPNFWWNIAETGTQFHTPCAANPDGSPSSEMGIQHVALMVEDILEAKRTFDHEGIAYREAQIPGRGLQVFIHDPAGNMLEFFEQPKGA